MRGIPASQDAPAPRNRPVSSVGATISREYITATNHTSPSRSLQFRFQTCDTLGVQPSHHASTGYRTRPRRCRGPGACLRRSWRSHRLRLLGYAGEQVSHPAGPISPRKRTPQWSPPPCALDRNHPGLGGSPRGSGSRCSPLNSPAVGRSAPRPPDCPTSRA